MVLGKWLFTECVYLRSVLSEDKIGDYIVKISWRLLEGFEKKSDCIAVGKCYLEALINFVSIFAHYPKAAAK